MVVGKPRDPRPHGTLRKIIGNGYSLRVSCSRCGHSAPAPIAALAARVGWDRPVLAADLVPHLRCGACGLKVGPSGRDRDGNTISLTLTPPYD